MYSMKITKMSYTQCNNHNNQFTNQPAAGLYSRKNILEQFLTNLADKSLTEKAKFGIHALFTMDSSPS